MNTSVSSTTKTTPYERVFGQNPRSSIATFEQLAAQGIVIFGGPNWVKMVISLSATPAAVLLTKGYAQENLLK
jgi:hypothetical protein